MNVVIIDYGAGNVRSVMYALNRLGVEATLSRDAEQIQGADKVIFPGVGEAKYAMDCIREANLEQVIKGLKQPVMGVCLGMQLLCEYTEERDTDCLGVFEGKVIRFTDEFKIPHMGWNELQAPQGTLFKGIEQGQHAYFVHSYYLPVTPDTACQAQYGVSYTAALEKDNFYACQFHPEKSGDVGAQIIQNFLDL